MSEERCKINHCDKFEARSEKWHEGRKQFFVHCVCGASGWKAIHKQSRKPDHANLREYYSKGFCEICLRKPPDVRLEIHHVIPYAAGGEAVSENLWTVCSGCHGKIHYIRNKYNSDKKLISNFYADVEKYNDFA